MSAHAPSNARVEALSDAVFAFAMTLLILDVRIPIAELNTTREVWEALRGEGPAVFALLLSFVVILITWVNHRATMVLVVGASPSFLYANGFLLLTVATLPFPTGLLGELLWTDHAAPAVALYNALLALQAVGWILVTGTALRSGLTPDDASTATIEANRTNGYFALGLYSLLAVVGLWWPLPVAAVTTLSWAFWLVLGIRMRAGVE